MKMKTIYFTLLSVLVFGVVMVSCLKTEKPTEQTEDLQLKLSHELEKVGIFKSKEIFASPRSSCGPVTIGCHSTLTSYLTVNYNHPDYPGCNILVPITLIQCYNSSGIPISINFEISSNIENWGYSSDCARLKSHWLTLYQSNQIGQLEDELIHLYQNVSTYIETTYMSAYLFAYQINCPYSSIESNFIKRNCTSFCFTASEIGVSIYEPQCGEGCCVRKKVMCYDISTQTVNVISTNFSQLGTCYDNIPNCSPGDLGGNKCITPCQIMGG
jgi:hypothetical protein